MGLPVRFVKVIGTQCHFRISWGEDCPSCLGKGGKGYHNGELLLGYSDTPDDWDHWGKIFDYPLERWPTKCDHCPAVAPPFKVGACPCGCGEQRSRELPEVHVTLSTRSRYNTPSGRPEPGDVFEAAWLHKPGEPCHEWDNCDGEHLIAILPNGYSWHIDSRASNCTKPDDKLHRCWVRHGGPKTGHIDVGKNGLTCSAGAGSIIGGNWHGFLRNDQFVP
jgi:hypothetical protein